MEEKQDSIWYRIQHIRREYLYLLIIVSMIIPLMRPLGLPISISPQTRTLYDSLNTLEQGDVVLEFVDWGAGSMSFHQPGCIAISYQAVERGAKLVFLSSSAEGPLMYDLFVKKFQPVLDEAGYVYGEDYVYLGYVAGEETALAAIASDMWSAFSADYFGAPLDDLPLMQSVYDSSDYAMIVSYTMGSPESFVRQFNTQHGVTTHIHCGEMMTPTILPFWASGQITGLLNGGVGAAEIEVLVKRPGDAVKLTDVYSFSNILVFVFLIVGNIGFVMQRRNGE